MKSLLGIFRSPRGEASPREASEPDSDIAPLCDAINKVEGCATVSSCSQHHFSDDESDCPADLTSGGRQVYVTVMFENSTALGVIVDAFTASPYRWKLIMTRRHGRDYDFEPNQIRMIFQYMFDNKAGRDKEFRRIITFINRRLAR